MASADDSPSDLYRGWVMIDTDKLVQHCDRSYEKSVLCTTSSAIGSLYIENGTLHISASPYRNIHALTEIRCNTGVKAEEDPLTETAIDLDTLRSRVMERDVKPAYIRIRVEAFLGNCAYSWAFCLDEIASAL